MSREPWQKHAFAFGISAGMGVLIGSVLDVYVLETTKREATVQWAVGATIIVVTGIFYLVTRRHWDTGN